MLGNEPLKLNHVLDENFLLHTYWQLFEEAMSPLGNHTLA